MGNCKLLIVGKIAQKRELGYCDNTNDEECISRCRRIAKPQVRENFVISSDHNRIEHMKNRYKRPFEGQKDIQGLKGGFDQ